MMITRISAVALLLACTPADAPPGPDRLGTPTTPASTTSTTPSTPCDVPLAVVPSAAAALPGGLVLLIATGGSGQVLFTLDAPELGTVNADSGAFVAADAIGETAEFTATDRVCGDTAQADVRIVGPLDVVPLSARLAPDDALTFDVSAGSGEWSCALASSQSGAALDDACRYVSGRFPGRDVVRFSDDQTGAFVDVDVDVDESAVFTVPGHAGVFVPRGSRWVPQPTAGSGVLRLEVMSGPLRVDGDGIAADEDGPGRVRLTDAHAELSLEVPVRGVAPLLTRAPRDGERTGGGHVLPLGDVDGDGFADAALAFVEPSVDRHFGGIVAIYAGTVDGLAPEPVQVFAGTTSLQTLGRAVATADIDGDGRQDLLIGADRADKGFTNVGSVAIHAAVPGGFFQTTPWRTLYGQLAFGRFGSAIAVCDFDGDGLLDLAVGALDESDIAVAEPVDDEGGVHIFRGDPAGLADQADFVLFGGARGGHLGTALATGDLDGDGRCDLVAGAPAADDDDGVARVYRGDAVDVLSRTPVRTYAGPPGDGGELGRRLATGDVDGDGADDLLLSAWRSDTPATDAGAVWLHLGGSLADRADPVLPDEADWEVTGGASTDHVGSDVQLQDLEGDGVPDIVVGAYRQEDGPTNAGAVKVWSAVADALVPGETVTAGAPTWTTWGRDAQGRFGQAAALIGDQDRDQVSELAVLAGYSSALGPEAGLPFSVPFRGEMTALELPGGPAGHEYGRSLAVFDVHGDGWDDLLVGAPGVGADGIGGNAGGVFVHAGGPDGFAEDEDLWGGTFPTWTGSDRFGYALAAAGDFDGDGHADLAVVSRADSRPDSLSDAVNPDECLGYRSMAGAVYVYRGGPEGLEEEPAFVHYGPESSGLIYALDAGFDADGDGRTDLVIGSTAWGSGGGFALVYGQAADPAGITVLCDATRWYGPSEFDRAGQSVAAIGDLDGDGCDEVAVGATGEDVEPEWNNQGTVRVVWGAGPACASDEYRMTTLLVETIGTGLGSAVTGGQDVDGDGLPDLLSGAAEYRVDFSELGAAWLTPSAWLLTAPAVEIPPGDLPLVDVVYDYVVPVGGDRARLGLVGSDAAGRFGAATALVTDPTDPARAAVAVGVPRGRQGGTWLGGAVVVHRYGATGLDPVPAWLVAGEARPGMLGDTLLSHGSTLLIGAPDSFQGGVELGAVYVITLE
ncbi:MAG: hypothetical protein ACI8PZ_000374 [Myxococcota bacterium]|jgi:hypothetical protein